MTAPMLTVRYDDLPYRDWRAWRALRANPTTVVVHETRTPCAGQRWIFHPIFRRSPDLTRMAVVDASRRPHYLPVVCERCRGLGHLVSVTAVEVTK